MQPTHPRSPRFHVDGELQAGAQFMLPADAGHHASRVLRLREGSPITLFNGLGGESRARILQLSRDGVKVEIDACLAIERESPLSITVAQAVSAGDRMDLTIQKAVELGAFAIQPLLADRSVVRLTGERSGSRREHWQRVATAACEQCGRNRVPIVAAALATEDYRAPESALKLLLAPGGAISLRSAGVASDRPIVLAAGPEAGFSPREELLLAAAGFVPVHLGPRVLRSETAAPAALAALAALYGDA